MHIVQICPVIGQGTGIAGVAWNLEREFRQMGHTVDSFTMDSARRRPRRPWPKHPMLRAFALFRQTVWFSTVGTVRARRFLAQRPGAVSICHNNVLAGDVYVDHGIVGMPKRLAGRSLWRMLINPTFPFVYLRESIRYRSSAHHVVVAVSTTEAQILRRTFRRVRAPVEVIANGVDLDRFHPPGLAEREDARRQFHLDDDDRVVLFVGHDFAGKGLDVAIDALRSATTVLLLVAGGNQQSIEAGRRRAEAAGVAPRVLFMGPRSDLPLFFAAADIFVLPSVYEAHGLVILEALASGVPVVATRVGCAPDVVVDGENGYLVDRDATQLGSRLEQLAAADLSNMRERARASAEAHSWRTSAERYITLLETLQPALRLPPSDPTRSARQTKGRPAR